MASRQARGLLGLALLITVAIAGIAAAPRLKLWMGKQPDGSFLVSTGQRIEGTGLPFRGRPIDLAMHPSGQFVAVLNKSNVFLLDEKGEMEGSSAPLAANAAFRGLVWTPDGTTLIASTDKGHLLPFALDLGARKLKRLNPVRLAPDNEKANPVPGGITMTRDGKTLYVTAANRNSVIEFDVATMSRKREFPVQILPFEPRLSEDEKTLLVSNWGGRIPQPGDRTAKSEKLDVVIDERGASASGTVSLINLATGQTRHVEVGLHPTAIAVRQGHAYVANAASDTISEVEIESAQVTRTIPIKWAALRVRGSLPNALAIRGETLFVANGGDNALCEIDLPSGAVKGFRPAGYFPVAVALSPEAPRAWVLNTKGNGSVARTTLGRPGNAHDFQGTVNLLDLTKPLEAETRIVAANNRWDKTIERPSLKVYNGAIEHVIYIIKENRTYDEIFGDLPQGNGDPKLCSLGEKVMPNHREIAQQFTLFDNGNVSGTNSADGHNWTTQSLANDYLEHFYVGYSRTYPDDGSDAMAISFAGGLWDAAIKAGKTLRVYGEFCDDDKARIEPPPKDWFEVWEDRQAGTGKFKFFAEATLLPLKPHINPEYLYWPLWQCDQIRADIFLKEYQRMSQANQVPNLTILSLPCDHAEGLNPRYPTPRAMMADNDLALGRIVEAVSRSPQWKSTCIFVIEDDAQSGPDHVDGHRTVFMAISPYTRRKYVDSTFYTTTNMVRSIEMMLGLEPMNRFDALSEPIASCFTDDLDLTPYSARPNAIPLDERNPSGRDMTAQDRFWQEKTLELDWSHIDAPDPYWLNRINWYSIFRGARPYPDRAGEAPGQELDTD